MKLLVSRIIGLLSRDALLLHTVLLFAATMVTSVCNIGFQMVVSRALPKPEYALLATFLALIAIASRPLGTLSTALTRSCSLLAKEGQTGTIRRLLFKWNLLAGLPAVVLALLAILFSSYIAAFFHLERRAPVVVAAIALPGICISPVLSGGINGLQRFGWISLSSIIGAAGRVAFGAVFVLLVAPACGWALAGHVGGLYISLAISFLVLWRLLAGTVPDQQALPSLKTYLVQCFVVQIAAAVLMTGDVVLVQRYVPDDTGFAFAATLGRMVTFMAVSVAMAMFPKVSSSGDFSKEHRRVFLRSQLYTGGFVLLALLLCCLIPELLHRILFRITEPDAALIRQTRWMAVVMGISTLLNTNVSLLLAQHRFAGAWVVAGSAALYLLGARLFHASALQIVGIGGLMNLLAFGLTSVFIFRIKSAEKGREND